MSTVNTYSKYCPNVFLAKCPEKHSAGETIIVQTKYGKSNECIVFNLVYEREAFYYYSIVRADGFDTNKWAKRKAERYANSAATAESNGLQHYHLSNKDAAFLSLGEPIKIGHHSEKRHRRAIEQVNENMRKSVAYSEKAEDYETRSQYWMQKTQDINLSMPESINFYEIELARAKEYHEGLMSGKYERKHSFSLTYANKDLKEVKKKLELSKKLWA